MLYNTQRQWLHQALQESCGMQSNAPPKMSSSLSLELVNMLIHLDASKFRI
jgi:hypothetical protein